MIMKKYIMIFTAVALLMIGCQKEESNSDNDNPQPCTPEAQAMVGVWQTAMDWHVTRPDGEDEIFICGDYTMTITNPSGNNIHIQAVSNMVNDPTEYNMNATVGTDYVVHFQPTVLNFGTGNSTYVESRTTICRFYDDWSEDYMIGGDAYFYINDGVFQGDSAWLYIAAQKLKE